jgi:hypothetical protein
MRSVLQYFAGFVLAVSALFMGFAVMALVNDPPSQAAANAQILIALVGLVLFAGILWMLADISNALHPKPEVAAAAVSEPERA